MSSDGTLSVPRVSLVGFAEYVGAPTSGRLACVRNQLRNYEADYRPGADFYRDFVDALRAGRQGSDDELSLQRAISRQNLAVRADNYRDLRRHWLAMPELHLPSVGVDRTFWEVPGLQVSLAPELALQDKKRTLVIKLWLRQAEPTSDAIAAAHWLLANGMPDLLDGGTAAVLDLRRQKLHVISKRKFRRGFDMALRIEAESMGRLWQQLARPA